MGKPISQRSVRVMDRFVASIIAIIVLVAALAGVLIYHHYEEIANAPYITLQELCTNKTAYEGHYVKVNGTLEKNIDTQIEHSFIMILIPIVHSDGKTTYTTFIPMWIPITHKYNIYTFADGNYSIALCHEGSLDKYLGKYVTVEGNVDGVRADENGHTVNYVLEADVIG